MSDIFMLFSKFLLIECINTVSTYQCYSCSSVMYNGCGDPFDPDGLTTMKTSAGEVCAVRLIQWFS